MKSGLKVKRKRKKGENQEKKLQFLFFQHFYAVGTNFTNEKALFYAKFFEHCTVLMTITQKFLFSSNTDKNDLDKSFQLVKHFSVIPL